MQETTSVGSVSDPSTIKPKETNDQKDIIIKGISDNGNLYNSSCQATESLNSAGKTIFLHQTNRGGGKQIIKFNNLMSPSSLHMKR